MSDPVLQVRDLRVHYHTPAGIVKAVNGVSFDLPRGQNLGLVGESVSG
jgi:peptide/nickel transport system ATP-binding protein